MYPTAGARKTLECNHGILARSLAARFAVDPVCPKVQNDNGILLAVPTLATITLGVQGVRRDLSCDGLVGFGGTAPVVNLDKFPGLAHGTVWVLRVVGEQMSDRLSLLYEAFLP